MMRPHPLISVQRAVQLHKIIEHSDYQPMPVRDFLIEVAVKGRGWPVPQRTAAVPILARIDTGRWLSDCPLGCGGAEMVDTKDPVFLCLSCGSGGEWHPVVFPGNRAAIETELLTRGSPNGWSWNPGETLAELEAETARLVEARLA